MANDEREGGKLESAVEEEDRSEPQEPPTLLTWTKHVAPTVREQTLHLSPHRCEEGQCSSSPLEGGGVPVILDKEDAELKSELDAGVEKPIGHPSLGCEDGPLVLNQEK